MKIKTIKKASKLSELKKRYDGAHSFVFLPTKRSRKQLTGYYLRKSKFDTQTVTLYVRVNEDETGFDLDEYKVPHELINCDPFATLKGAKIEREEAPKCVTDFEDEDEETILYSDGSIKTVVHKRRQQFKYRTNGQLRYGHNLSLQQIETLKRNGEYDQLIEAGLSVELRLSRAKAKREKVHKALRLLGKAVKESKSKKRGAYKLSGTINKKKVKPTKKKTAKRKSAKVVIVVETIPLGLGEAAVIAEILKGAKKTSTKK